MLRARSIDYRTLDTVMGESRLVIFRDLLNTRSTPLHQHGIVSFYEYFHNYLKVTMNVDPACEGGRREGGRRFIVTGGKVALRSLITSQLFTRQNC